MRPILFDADAFHCVRNLSILELLRQAPVEKTPFFITEYVARHELRDVERDVTALVAERRVQIMPVSRRKTDPEGERFRRYQEEKLDKGEAESLAWAKGIVGPKPLFISNDRKAREGFARHSVPAGDIMDLVVEAVNSNTIDRAATREKIAAAWDERPNHLCRPGDYDDFDSSFARRLSKRP